LPLIRNLPVVYPPPPAPNPTPDVAAAELGGSVPKAPAGEGERPECALDEGEEDLRIQNRDKPLATSSLSSVYSLSKWLDLNGEVFIVPGP